MGKVLHTAIPGNVGAEGPAALAVGGPPGLGVFPLPAAGSGGYGAAGFAGFGGSMPPVCPPHFPRLHQLQSS